MRRAVWLVWLLAFNAAALDGDSGRFQPLDFKSKTSAPKVLLGEPFEYELTLEHRPEQRFELVTPTSMDPFELVEQSRSRTDGEGKGTTRFKLKLALFDLGTKRIPDLQFKVFDQEGSGQFIAPGVDVEGAPTLPQDAEQEGAELKDIKPLEEVAVPSYRILWFLVGAVALAVLAWLAMRWFKRSRAVVAAPASPKPSHIRALEALQALHAEDLPSKGRIQEFHFRLSQILRGYLEERYAFEALESTSTELMAAVRRLRTPGLPVDGLDAFLRESDLVKFAKAPVGPNECKKALEFGYELVQKTIPSPPAHGTDLP